MNDIDRPVDSFDFAMRRRFRFVEVKADERLEMLANLNDEEKEADTNNQNKIINLLNFVFPHYLRSAMQKGVYKTYIKKK